MPTEEEIKKMQRESYEKFVGQRKKLSENLSKIKRKIAVYSGKGGVGKTLVAVNLAVSLSKAGFRVGLFDADIDCPNASQLFGCGERVKSSEQKIVPVVCSGVKFVSMDAVQGKQDKARIWRGPILTNAITELLSLTEWGELDFLIVDFPPSTSDAPLTLMQLVPLDGFIIVTTPQKLSCQDALRSGNMCIEMNQKIIGVVENMSGGAFGSGGAQEIAAELGTQVIATIPLSEKISQLGDDGEPAVNDEEVAAYFAPLVEKLKETESDSLKVL